jgi:hypothetical protein
LLRETRLRRIRVQLSFESFSARQMLRYAAVEQELCQELCA